MRTTLYVTATAVWGWLLTASALAAGDGERVGENVGDLLGGWAKSLYVGIAAVVALVFLLNRKFADLADLHPRRGRWWAGSSWRRATSPAWCATSGPPSPAEHPADGDPLLPARLRGRPADLPRRPLGAPGAGRRPAARGRLLRRRRAGGHPRGLRCPGSASWWTASRRRSGSSSSRSRSRCFGTQAAPDGRAAHRFAWDWLCLRLRARRRCAGRVVALEGEPVAWDGELPLRLGRRGHAAAPRPRARAGEDHLHRAGRAVGPRRAAGRPPGARGRAPDRRWCCARARGWSCGREPVPAPLRAPEHPRRARRRAGGAVPGRHGLLSVPGRGGQARRGWAGWRGSRSRSRPTSPSGACAAPIRPTSTRSRRRSCWTRAGSRRRRGARTCAGTRRTCASCAPSCPRSTSPCRCATDGSSGVVRGADRIRRRVEALFGVAAAVPIPVAEIEALIVAEERAFRRAGACLPAAARHDARAAVAAAPRRLPRCRRAGARRPLGAERADRRDRQRPARLRAAAAPTWRATPTRRSSSRTAPWSIDAEEGRSHQALLGMGALPEESEFPGGAELLFAPLEALPSRSTPCCTRAGSATARRSRACGGGSSTPTSPISEQLTSSHGPLSYTAEENRRLARELDAYLQSHERPPLLNCAISLAVGAPRRRSCSSSASRRCATASGRSRCTGRSGCSRRCSSTICRARTAASCATTPTC